MKKLVIPVICLISSIWLTVVFWSYFTLPAWLLFTICAAILLILLGLYAGFRPENLKKSSGRLAAALSFSLLILGAGYDCWMPAKIRGEQHALVKLTGLAQKTAVSEGTEVWVLDIVNGGKPGGIRKLTPGKSGWKKRQGSVVFSDTEPQTLEVLIPNPESPTINLRIHHWSGLVRIREGNKDTVVNLGTSGKEGIFQYKISEPSFYISQVPAQAVRLLLLCVLSLLIITVFVLPIFYLDNNAELITGLMVVTGLVLFIINNNFVLDDIEQPVLLLLTPLLGWVAGNAYNSGFTKLFNRWHLIALGVVSLYAAFGSAGNALFFLSPYSMVDGNSIGTYLLTAVWWWFAGMAFLYITERAGNMIARNRAVNPGKQKSNWWNFFLAPVLIWGIVLCIFFPALMSSDSMVQWDMGIGASPLNDWHPLLHTLIFRISIAVWKSPASIALFQIIFMSAVLASFSSFLYRKGVSAKLLLIVLVVFSLMANNIVLIVTLWKDIPFSSAVVWLTLVLIRIVTNDYRKPVFLILDLAFALFSATLLRHNGIMICAFTVAALLPFAIKQKNRSVIAGLAVSLVMIVSFKTIMLNMDGVIENKSSIKLIPPVKGIEAVMKYDGELPASAAFMDTILTRERWKELYQPYSPHGIMFRTDFVVINELDSVPTGDVLKAYAETFISNPRLIIWDKIKGCDLVWNVNEPDYHGLHYVEGIVENENGIVSSGWQAGRDVLWSYIKKTEAKPNILIWRVGLLNILVLFLAVGLSATKLKGSWMIFLPWLGGILSLVIATLEQDYRFVYFVFVLFWFLWLFIMMAMNTYRKREMEA